MDVSTITHGSDAQPSNFVPEFNAYLLLQTSWLKVNHSSALPRTPSDEMRWAHTMGTCAGVRRRKLDAYTYNADKSLTKQNVALRLNAVPMPGTISVLDIDSFI